MIEILCHAEGGGVVLEVIGELSAGTASTLRGCLEATLSADVGELTVDLRSVRRLDEAVTRVLVEHAERRAERGGSLRLRSGHTNLLDIPAIAPCAREVLSRTRAHS